MEKIQTKLTAIQSELKAPKNQYNSFGKYKYRSCEDILEAVKPLLVKHGLTLTLSDSIEYVGDRYYIVVAATISDGETSIYTEALAREADTKKGMDAAQITGAASSYARKYALSGLFLLDDSKDADASNGAHSGAESHNESAIQIKECISEIAQCETLTALNAHFKANKEFVETNGLTDYYAKRKEALK